MTPLTVREAEILVSVAQGKNNRQIASTLFLSTNTIKTHLLRTYRKLGVNNRAQAVQAAIRRGILVWPPEGLIRRGDQPDYSDDQQYTKPVC